MYSKMEGWDGNVLFLQVLPISQEEFTNNVSSITSGVVDRLNGLCSDLEGKFRHFSRQERWQTLLHKVITVFSGLTAKLPELSLRVTAPQEGD